MEYFKEIVEFISSPNFIENAKTYFKDSLIDVFIIIILYLIYIFVIAKEKDFSKIIDKYLINLSISIIISFIVLLYTNQFSLYFIPCLIGILSSNYIKEIIDYKIFGKNNKTSNEEDNPSNDNQNGKENAYDKKENLIIKNYYEPDLKDIKYDENINIIDVLNIYNYVSSNQVYKTLTECIFKTSEDQINFLLEMKALTQKELNEAYALLNLIKYYHRMITKEELYAYIAYNNLDLESKGIGEDKDEKD